MDITLKDLGRKDMGCGGCDGYLRKARHGLHGGRIPPFEALSTRANITNGCPGEEGERDTHPIDCECSIFLDLCMCHNDSGLTHLVLTR